VFIPGGGHLYARRAWTALVLAAEMVGCLAIAGTTRSAVAFEFAFAVLIATVACDAVGGVRAARAEARGEHRGRGRQMLRGLGLIGVAILVGGAARFASGAPRLVHTWKLSRYGVSCADNSIVIENGGDETAEIEIANLKIGAFSLYGRETYDVGIKGGRYLTLLPGGRGAVTPDVADWLARSCGFPSAPEPPAAAFLGIKALEAPEMPAPRSMQCGFAFAFAARKGMDDADGLGAVGTCVPPTSPGATAVGKLEPHR
jgi:hypothetical protein